MKISWLSAEKRLIIIIVYILSFSQLSLRARSSELSIQRPPNIVLIMADDVGMECFGCYGSDEYQTPSIDQLAESGIRFANCHSCPLCTPSRVKIMTGRSNVRNYHAFSILPRDEVTFAHLLQTAGYKTAVAGKWQLLGAETYGEHAGTGTTPEGAGFDEYCLWQVEKLGPRYWNPRLLQNGEFLDAGQRDYGPTLCTDFICDFIDRHRDEPFLVYYPMILPHNPFQPTPDSTDKLSKNKKQNFVDMVAYLDKLVGRIDRQLQESGVRDKTLLMFVADNGTNRNISSQFRGQIIRGGKSLTTDNGTHVPFVASWPGSIKPGSVCEDLVDFSDLLPTIAQLAGAKPPRDIVLDGISFARQLRGEPNPDARQAIYCYYNPRPGTQRFPNPVIFARDKRWKLYNDERLFDVVADRLEENPILPDDDDADSSSARRKLTEVISSMPSVGAKIRKPKDINN